MYKNKKYFRELILKAYSIIGNLTPINADCGELCARRCCSGGENDGMILFPGEAGLLPADGFSIKSVDVNGASVDFAVCSGRCRRVSRPLACRMFPFAPHVSKGNLEVIPDPRVRVICPLLSDGAAEFISKEFIDRLNAAFSHLWENEEMRVFIALLSKLLEGYIPF